MKRPIVATLLALVTSQLAGCQRGLDVQVIGSPTAPDFVLSGYDGPFGRGEQPAIDWMWVSGGDGSVWSLSRDPSCASTYRFHYGDVPAGWTASGPARPLQPGVTYTVSMSGCGFSGGKTFKDLGGKIVSAEGNGDAPISAINAMR